MASNALTIFDDVPTIPEDVASFFDEQANIVPRETVPSLSYEGKVWTISLNGEKTPLMRKNADGDEEPLSVMRVVILDYNKRRGRAYYQGAYDPAKAAMPVCWSDDGVKPSQYVKQPQSEVCAKCPMSVKGSKVTEQGKAVTACSEHRMIAVVPANRLDFEPLRLKLAITSDYDGQSPELEQQGWFAFKNYTDLLRTKQVQHTAMLVTKMRFDPGVAYPKVLFSADKWLDAAQLTQVVPVVKEEKVKALVSGSWTPDGVDGTPVKQLAAPAAEAPAPAAKPPAPVVAAPKAAPAPKATPAPAAPVATADRLQQMTAQLDEEEEPTLPDLPTKEAKVVAPKATKAAKATAAAPKANGAAAAPANTPEDLDKLLADWS